MKKILFVILCLFAEGANAQLRDYGSAKILSGTVYVFNIFIAEPGKPWKVSEKKAALKKSAFAHTWLIQKAEKQGKSLRFIVESNIDSRDVIIAKIPTFNNYHIDILDNAVKLSGFQSIKQFKKWVQDRVKYDSILVALYANKAGRSFAVTSLKDMEGFLAYKTYDEGYDLYTSTIAHETLHCFGAIDLYTDPTFPRRFNQNAERANQLWPHDIMHEVPYSINSAKLGPLSSWLVGIGHHDPIFDSFKPK